MAFIPAIVFLFQETLIQSFFQNTEGKAGREEAKPAMKNLFMEVKGNE